MLIIHLQFMLLQFVWEDKMEVLSVLSVIETQVALTILFQNQV